MDPVVDNDWLSCKNDPVDEAENVGNFVRSCQWRELGLDPPHSLANKAVLENMAEDRLVQKQLKFRSCDLPDTPRSTFLIVFSPDGTKIASTHLNHNIYISELATGKHVKILKGHPRTPWSIGFHPSHPHLIGSGCLGGQVRVWDLSGGSEVWTAGSGAVIASVAFHPRDQLLVVATLNELYFWDWSQPAPFTKVCTNNINEKVKYVAFDALGHKLITGISVWGSSGAAALQHAAGPPAPRRDPPAAAAAAADGSAQEMIVNSYQNLVQRYDNLVRNYQRLFMARHELSNAPPSNTTDRGTDPMETDAAPPQWTRVRRAAERAWRETEGSSRRTEGSESADLDNPSSRLLNLGVLSIRSNPPRYNMEVQTNAERTVFGSRTSAFQRLNDYPERLGAGSAERSRWLPNPFSSSTAPRSNSSSSQTQHDASSSRTSSAFSSLRMGSDAYIIRNYLARQAETRTSPPADRPSTSHDDAGSSRTRAINTLRDFVERDDSPLFRQNVHPRSGRGSRRSTSPSRRPTDRTDRPDRQTDGPAAEPPHISPAAAQTINESLDLIRDILRDSGTRLLNLITNMSLSTLASVEHGAHSPPRPRVRLFSSNLRRDLISSESESDSDPSLEVNVLRRSTPPRDPAPGARPRPTNRMVVDLHHMDDDDDLSSTNFLDSLNVSVSNSRFRVRSHSTDEPRAPGRRRRSPPTPRATPPLPGRRRRRSPPTPPATPPLPGRRSRSPSTPRATTPLPDRRSLSPPTPRATPPLPDPSRPSTSADTSWMQDRSSDRSGPATPSREAYRKVKAGVIALQKHTAVLTDLWGRGYRATTRDLRLMWEALRRRVLLLHRQTGRDPRGYYTRGLMERCRLLTELTRSVPRRTRREFLDNEDSQHTQMSTDSTSSSLQTEPEPPSPRPRPAPRRSQPPTASLIRSAQQRRRLQTTYRWRHEDEARRRSRWQPRAPRPSRRDSRSFDLQCTRNDIRMRAMQVLSIMFNMMMNCLEERGLSQLIIVMLRALKRALTLTCLMLMTNRLNRDREGSSNRNDGASEEAGASRQEPGAGSPREGDGAADNNTTINNETGERTSNTGRLDDNDSNSTSSWPTSDSDEEQPRKRRRADDGRAASRTAGRPRAPPAPRAPHAARPPRAPAPRWSNRLAVQISAANRNTSLTARTRRDLYMESKRQKALHRTNPSVHPIARRRVQPPSSTSRIPTMRSLPPKPKTPEPTPGPSTSQAGPPEAPAREAEPAAAGGLDIEHRVNLFRIAHMHAVRLRSAARSRLRRLQTIRLYTPSAVREMFGLQSNNNEQGDGVGLAGLAGGARFAAYRPAAGGAGEGEAGAGGARFAAYRPAAEAGDAGALGAEAGEPAPLGEGPPLADAPDAPGPHGDGARPPLRMPRVLEYLQPIILSQNALVVEEGGALGSLLDAGLVGDALPASTHRVQAWDFAAGDLPDIADRKKNVVVPRCRIHNDASIDVSRDGRILVALLPVARLRNTNHWLGVYSLEWGRLGQCLHTAMLGQSVVSVALSPTARHLAVGFGSRRFTTLPHARNNVFALLYRLSSTESTSRTGLSPIKELEQNWELGVTSLNCLRWAPQPGQGLVYANNTGQLIVMS